MMDMELPYKSPATAEELRSYLLGDWTLKKAMAYKLGGVSGRFEGVATFRNLHLPSPHEVVAFSESGTFTGLGDDPQQLDTRNALLYDFTECYRRAGAPVAVLFDESEDRRAESAEALLAAARPLHTIEPGSLVLSEHTDALGTVWQGALEIEASDAFLLSWEGRGDAMEASILSFFSRRPSTQSEA